MRILLIGEFSRFHNSLKEGLEKLGHEVLLIGTSNGFKDYEVDINIDNKFIKNKFTIFLNKAFTKLFDIELRALGQTFTFMLNIDKLKNYQCVQLIHEAPITEGSPLLNIFVLKKIKKYNKNMFQLSAGDDSINIKYAFDGKFKYSVATPLMENSDDEFILKRYKRFYRFFTKNYGKLKTFLMKNINGIIAIDMDYHIPLIGYEKYLGLIPGPINIDLLNYQPVTINDKIKIFHGINCESYYHKGNNFFEKALEVISERYKDKVEITTVRSVPYDEYINSYNNCHILLDQVYSYDQGYNALEAMAKGKVVFTGAEQEFLDFYELKKNEVCVNAVPNVESIVDELEYLILNPEIIEEISKNARKFIEEKHDYVKIAEKYVEVWNKNSVGSN